MASNLLLPIVIRNNPNLIQNESDNEIEIIKVITGSSSSSSSNNRYNSRPIPFRVKTESDYKNSFNLMTKSNLIENESDPFILVSNLFGKFKMDHY